MMKNLTSRQKILFGVYAMILAMLGDYLLGFGTFSFSDSPDAYLGMTAKTEPIIDTMCHLSVQFLYARKALKTGAFQAITGESALPEERQTACFMPGWPCSGLRAEKLSFHQKKRLWGAVHLVHPR